LDDYAFVAAAALDLGRTDDARDYAAVILKHFRDADAPGFFFTSDDHESLLQRPKSLFDQAVPSGLALSLEIMVALSEIYPAEPAFADEVHRSLPSLMPLVLENPYGHGEAACAALLSALGPVAWSGPAPQHHHAHFFIKGGAAADGTYCQRGACHPLPEDTAPLIRWP
jgi:uncharacterized protein YyaL (SSP411 family)